MLPLLAASDYGLVVGIGFILLMFILVGWVIVQGTRAQLYWRKLVDEGNVEAITTLVTEEIDRWKTARMPKGTDPVAWHGVQSAELIGVTPDSVRVSASAEGQYAMVDGTRREVSSALEDGMRVTAKLADMLMYDMPNVRLPFAQVDVYSTFRDDSGSSQRCILTTRCSREIADGLDWDDMAPADIVRAFGGRFLLDDRGNPLPVDPEVKNAAGVPAAFYKDD